MIGDAGEHVGEPGLRIDVVELGRVDQRVHDRGALAAAIGAGEQPGLAAEGNAAQRSLGGVVGQADAAVVEEAGEGVQRLSM